MRSTTFRDAPDFKANPARAVIRRLRWRLHWKVAPQTPFRVSDWWSGLQIVLPNSGAAAQIYYAGLSTPQIAELMSRTLRRGMTVFDIGAHAGEYSLIAASLTGPSGIVHAFEPQSALAAVIRANLEVNNLTNTEVHEIAVGAASGQIGFVSDSRSLGGWTSQAGASVRCVTLDDFVQERGAAPDFIKLDAAGNELGALEGATETLSNNGPTIILKLYHPDVTTERHGYHLGKIIDLLAAHGYNMRLIDAPTTDGVVAVRSFADMAHFFDDAATYSLSLCATR